MSMDELRRLTIVELASARETLVNLLLNTQFARGSENAPPTTAEQIALQTVERTAQLRAFLLAEKALNDAYRKLTNPDGVSEKAAPKEQRSPY